MDRLVDAGGNVLAVEAISQELVGEPVTVCNFQVEGFHTYYAGALSVLVHNANYPEDVRGMQEQAISEKEGAGEPLKDGTPALAQYGDNFGKVGTYVENPDIKVDWTQHAEHAAERMQQ